MFFSDSLSVDLLSLLVSFLVVVVGYYKWCYQYWKRKNLSYLEPKIPFGSVSGPFSSREHKGIKIKRLYDAMKEKGWKHGGIYFFSAPAYLVIDLDYIKNIMTKDFQYFTDRGLYYNEKSDPLSAHLLNINGNQWRNLRTKLTPTFTSGKMRMMFQTLIECEANLQKKMELEYKKGAPIDIKDILGCFTTDIIGSCAFGLDCRTFEDEESPFRKYGKKLLDRTPMINLKRTFALNYPNLARSLGVALVPSDISSFFMKIVKDTIAFREKNQISRKDFMQLLIDLKNEDDAALTIEQIAAQSFVFFIAGFETSSTTMTFTLYELARHQDIQEKVREEIRTVLAKYDGKITYDAIQELKYMNQVLDESLRMYPPAALVPRRCVKDYKIPGQDIIIDKGTMVMIPILGIHYDREYYPDPENFDPERFSEENKNLRHSYAHIPFGEGPRNCIGMRFGLMQSKVGLTSLLNNFKFTVSEKTQEPLKMKSNSLVLAAQGEIWLKAEKIECT